MSDTSLRDALEKLCDRYDRIADEVSVRGGVKASYDIPGSEIRYVLAAHPAEPVGVSDERAVCNACGWEGETVHDVCPACRQDTLNYFTPGSAPVVGVSDEAVAAFSDAYLQELLSRVDTASLPSAAAVRAGLVAAQAVQPQVVASRPTREQIEERIRRMYTDGGASDGVAREVAAEIAGAVLALMGGCGVVADSVEDLNDREKAAALEDFARAFCEEYWDDQGTRFVIDGSAGVSPETARVLRLLFNAARSVVDPEWARLQDRE